MTDLADKEIKVGDRVRVIKLTRGSFYTMLAEVIGFTPQRVRVRFTGPYAHRGEALKLPDYLVILEPEIEF